MSVVTEAKLQKDSEKDEIDIRLGDTVKFLRNSRRSIGLWLIVFSLIGAIYACTQPNEYTTMVRLMPELKSTSGASGLGDLKSLAGLAGINIDNLGGATEAIRPDLYPDIMQSLPFALYMMEQSVTTHDSKKPKSLKQYLVEQSENTFSGSVAKWFSSNDQNQASNLKVNGQELKLTTEQEALSKIISKRVSVVLDKKTGILSIISQMPDPEVAAIVARNALSYLTNYVTSYRTGKARMHETFLSRQVANSRQRYQETEKALSAYRDQNRSVYLNTAKIEEQRLQADYLLAQTVYNDLSKQLEQARIKVQEEAPVFQILEPARVPLKKSGPQRVVIILGFAVLGACFSIIIQIVRRFLKIQ